MRHLRWVLFAAAAALSASTIWFGIAPHDEGLMLQAARRIGDGQWPYRDFWWNYGPGQPLLLSPFGGSLVAWRVLRVLLDAIVALLAFELAWRLVDEGRDAARAPHAVVPAARWVRFLPLAAWLAVAGAMAFPTGPGPNPAALALGFGALYVAPRDARAAGILAGVATLFRVEIGVAVALGLALSGARRAVPWAAGTAVVAWLPFLLVAPGDLLDDTVGFLGIQGKQRLPFPLDPSGLGRDPNKLLELWMPAILVAGLVLVAVLAAVRRRPSRTVLALAPLALVSLAYLLGRTDEFHLVPLAAVLPLLVAGAAAAEPRAAIRIVLLAVLALIAVHGLERKAGQLLHRPALGQLPGTPVRAEAAEARDLRRLAAAVEGRRIFVVPPRIDRVTVGNPLVYVLTGTVNPTRYDVLQPGLVTTAKVQREMVRDLRRARPDVLVRWTDPRTAPEDNASGRERGARILDTYLARTFTGPERTIGRFTLTAR